MSGRSFGIPDEALLTRATVFRDDLLRGRTALVTGAGSGIGKAISVLFARLGARIVLASRSEEKLATTAALLDRIGADHHVKPTNIRDPEQVDALFEALEADGIVPDVLINNAGGQFPQASAALSDKGWRAVIDTNLNGTWTMMQRAARLWQREQVPGAIVNIIAPHLRGMYGLAHTVAARAAVDHLSRNLAVEWAPDRIRVNCVLPGPIDTEGMNVYPPEAQARMARSNPMMRLGDAQDIAQACVYLAADSGRFITGETLVVDGGHQLWGELWLTDKPSYFDG
ncbi:MAG: SDR family oxidoreductase [bacterium]|nr:SDR family oxidoreductase [bacterium]